MNVDFCRFKATDDVDLQGWLNNESSDVAVVHVHGMSGNGYENYFLDNLRATYAIANISMFAIDTRGHGIISDFRQGDSNKHGGSCFEIFEESVYDILGAIDYLKTLGKSKFILQGHSLGCMKVVNFVLTQSAPYVTKVILLAPTDMTGWASTDVHHQAYLRKAKDLLSKGKGEELVNAQCWLDKTPISAQTYPTICEAGSAADIYGNREGGTLLGRVTIPTLIPYGDEDIGITKIDGTIDAWLKRINKIKNVHTQISIIKGATHSFAEHEAELSAAVQGFLE
ncbi:MAG TPA: alpha/beta fold hydrolase [Candidatus Saccharimonadales bacterium]|nr:alpha/beta fold hydrolase [Candidatus Saccharimonadales bacterium]